MLSNVCFILKFLSFLIMYLYGELQKNVQQLSCHWWVECVTEHKKRQQDLWLNLTEGWQKHVEIVFKVIKSHSITCLVHRYVEEKRIM